MDKEESYQNERSPPAMCATSCDATTLTAIVAADTSFCSVCTEPSSTVATMVTVKTASNRSTI